MSDTPKLPETEICACIRVETGAVSHYAPNEAEARADIGTDNLRFYRFETVSARVVFVVVDTDWDNAGAHRVCLTYEAAQRHATRESDSIEVWLVSE